MLQKDKVKATGGQGRTAPAREVDQSSGTELADWKTAASAELQAFIDKGCMHVTTPEERAAYKKPLPMLCVWTEKADKSKKCRACIMGNLEQLDATAQVWTAQAETASFFTALKLSQLRGWKVSKHDVKTAFLRGDKSEKDRDGYLEPSAEIKPRFKMTDQHQLAANWGLYRRGKAMKFDKYA